MIQWRKKTAWLKRAVLLCVLEHAGAVDTIT